MKIENKQDEDQRESTYWNESDNEKLKPSSRSDGAVFRSKQIVLVDLTTENDQWELESKQNTTN